MSDLTPQTDVPTPTTDKITQAARETIYLCNFRVSVDGEWLCLRELNDISLTPDPEPTHEDPKDPIAIERLNLMNMAKLSIKGLIESALNLGRTLDSDYAPLQQFFVVMEHCLKHGLKTKKTFLGQNKSFWGALELVEKLTPEAGEITASVKDLPGLKTPLGRGRAWLRLALMQKKLSDYMKTIINRKDLLSEFYEANALMMEEEGAVIAGLLVGLNVIDANLCMKGEDLDSQVGVIDFSMYLKDSGNSSKSTEGDGQITAILDQKNYVEELNRHLSASVNNLQAKVDVLEKSNTKLTEELAVANNRIITLQEDVERVKEESSYQMESNRKALRSDAAVPVATDGQSLGETRKQLKEETLLRLDVEKELEVQIGMKQEMELSMKMLEKDVCEKQDALVELRTQMEDIRTFNQQLTHKAQSSEASSKQKGDIITGLEDKINQMAGTVKQLESRSKQAQRERDLAQEANRLFKQEFGDKIESLQTEVEHLRKQRYKLDLELRRERARKSDQPFGTQPTVPSVPQKGRPHTEQAVTRHSLKVNVPDSEKAQEDASEDKTAEGSPTPSSECEDVKEKSVLELSQLSICTICEQEESLTRIKKRCKNCSGVFCESCLTNELPLPSSILPENVCDTCYFLLLQQYASSPT
ncbi:protein RUFY3 isoform X2 [Gadus morhua]|uniref:Protein RUFY3 n=1 Tax=Gadus morhua TaxID=8049 RepID=A0A8C5B794_GADMO|nr:protein RUFY3 isoform X2 [Gadus morhua]XP_056448165.1 protein RUFY3-like isoform X3 [Gadus chalcogrammus]